MKLNELKKIVIDCDKCELHKENIKRVFGTGTKSAEIMVIGKHPSKRDYKEEKPFTGKYGDILRGLFKEQDIKLEKVFFTTLLKCATNKSKQEYYNQCVTFLDKQIETIRPKIIITLGNTTSKYILNKFELVDNVPGISEIHGKAYPVYTLNIGKIDIIPFYHPAVSMYPALLEVLKEDMKKVKERLQ